MNWAEWDMSIDVVLQVRRHGGTATACSSSEDGVNGTVTVAHSTAGLPASACGLYSWRPVLPTEVVKLTVASVSPSPCPSHHSVNLTPTL
jgi:hypothetical protein